MHETTPPRLAAKADQSPFLFLFAPSFHPAMARIAPVRKELAFPTVFNLLGPLINPAAPSATVVGVHSRYLGHLFAESLRLMAVRSAWVVCGNEGLDELSPAGPSHVRGSACPHSMPAGLTVRSPICVYAGLASPRRRDHRI